MATQGQTGWGGPTVPDPNELLKATKIPDTPQMQDCSMSLSIALLATMGSLMFFIISLISFWKQLVPPAPPRGG